MSAAVIDVTPTWSALLRVLLELHTTATTAEARNMALAELQRMARIADQCIEQQRKLVKLEEAVTSSFTGLLVEVCEGHPIPWLFDSRNEYQQAITAFQKAGIEPFEFTSELWNDSDEVVCAMTERGLLGKVRE